jgi:hypothetical protein
MSETLCLGVWWGYRICIGATTLSIITFSKRTLYILGLICSSNPKGIQLNYARHNDTHCITFSIMTLSI